MKTAVLLFLFMVKAWAAEVVTLTNTQGRVYQDIRLIRTNDTGLIYGLAGTDSPVGMIPFSLLAPPVLEGLGIPTNKIAEAEEALRNAERSRLSSEAIALKRNEIRNAINAEGRLALARQEALSRIQQARNRIEWLAKKIEADKAESRRLWDRWFYTDSDVWNVQTATSGSVADTVYTRLQAARDMDATISNNQLALEQAQTQLQALEAEYERVYSNTTTKRSTTTEAAPAVSE